MNLQPLEPLPDDEDEKAEFEAAVARFEALRDEDPDLEQAGWRLVSRGTRHKGSGPTTTFSFRLEPAEITELYHAAEARGMNMSEFIRAAALTIARSPMPTSDTSDVLPEVLDETEKALSQAYERALTEVRHIRERAEHSYRADPPLEG